jgi:amino acid adenylation domain-containing protein
MLFLTAFKVLLYRYTGEEDIIVGAPILGRQRLETENLIGCFINTLALRDNLGNNPSFKELLQQVKNTCLEAYTNQDLPFEKLIEDLQPERNLTNSSIFQVLFNSPKFYHHSFPECESFVELVKREVETAMFDLSLYRCRENSKELEIAFNYSCDLFQLEIIERMSEHFQRLLTGIVNNPTEKIDEIKLLKSERNKYKLSQNKIIPPILFTEFTKQQIEQSIPARFAQQVQKYPENIAIKSKKYCWNYAQLNKFVKAIAYQINQLESSHETTRIGLLFENDAPAIAAIFGVLSAGKNYIPLDASYPQVRLKYILENAEVTVIITNNNNYNLARDLTQKNIAIINFDEIKLNQNQENQLSIEPDHIAYILYTSGSTGKPKGVVQNHRNVLHFIRNYTNNLRIFNNDKLTLISSISFDAAVMDIFGALLNGATLYPLDVKNQNMSDLVECLIREKITIYHSTPTVYRYLMETLATNNLLTINELRLVVLGGEKVVKTDVDFYQKYLPESCIFINGFGPTESTVTLQKLINKTTGNREENIPIGYPVEDTEILLLNERGINNEVYGEIAIKSPYVALEYWQQPTLTQERFILAKNNQKIYRTGDIGRLNVDGSILFLGRKDNQIKIRGFRIELEEIEATLNQLPQIKESLVIAKETEKGDRFLVAYLILKQEILRREIRQFLKAKLPDYMIPSAFVFLDKFSLNPNGKIDKKALPEPDFNSQKESEFIAPCNEKEIKLVEIWQQVLAKKYIGINDDFFDLGGHSLLAIQIISRIRAIFQVEVPLRILFQYPTIAQLSDYLEVYLPSNPQPEWEIMETGEI